MSRAPARGAGFRSWRASVWPPTFVVALGYVAVTVIILRAFDYNPTGPIRIGSLLPAHQFWTDNVIVQPGVGYDGQWFFYIAHDPLLRAPDPETYLDQPAYRYARILYPTLAWALAFGQPAALPWSLFAVNLLAVLGGTVACVDILRQLQVNRWLAIGYAFSPPVIIGVSATLAEPVALALVVAGVALALRSRHWLAGALLTLAVLAREPSLLVPLGFGLYALARLDWRRCAAYLLPLGVPIAWHLSILARLGSLPSSQSPPNFGVPFGGAYYRLGLLLGWHPPALGEAILPESVWPEVVVIVASIAVVLVGLTKILERRDVFAWQLWLQAALALGTTEAVWIGLGSYGRVLGPLYLAFALMLVTHPRRMAMLPARLHEWTISVPARTILSRQGDNPVPPAVPAAFSPLKRTEKWS